MKTMLVQYRCKADRVAENVALVEAVFAELARAAPPGLHYATFRLPDGVSFAHLVASEPGVALSSFAAFQAFVAGIKDRCEVAPVAQEVQPVGAYAMFG